MRGCLRQSGFTVIELLIGMAVTSAVLLALTGILYTVSDRFEHWSERVSSASAGFALAAAVQADGHSYAPCAEGRQATLELCQPCHSRPVVTYTVERSPDSSGGTTYLFTRRQPGAPGTLVARVGRPVGAPPSGEPATPYFRVESWPGPGAVSGRIDIYGVRAPAPSLPSEPTDGQLSVFFNAPAGGCR